MPGNADAVFTFGHSGGGAQSALMGATGDADSFTPYLEAIGAVMEDANGNPISDATSGAMCWCPITCLDEADAAYEWMMGQFDFSSTREEARGQPPCLVIWPEATPSMSTRQVLWMRTGPR